MNKYYCWFYNQSWHDGDAFYSSSEEDAAIEYIESLRAVDIQGKQVICVQDHGSISNPVRKFTITCKLNVECEEIE